MSSTLDSYSPGDLSVVITSVLLFAVLSIVTLVYSYLRGKGETGIEKAIRLDFEYNEATTWINNFETMCSSFFLFPFKQNMDKMIRVRVITMFILWLLMMISFILFLVAGKDLGSFLKVRQVAVGLFVVSINLMITLNLILYLWRKHQIHLARLRRETLNGIVHSEGIKAIQSDYFKRDLYNYLQIAVLVIEFFQLLSFPLQDLHRNLYFLNQSDSDTWLKKFMSTVQNGVPNLNTSFLSTLHFIAVFTVCMAALFITLVLHFFNRLFKKKHQRYPRFIRLMGWIATPTIVAYVPILITFISTFKCLIDWQTPLDGSADDEALRCYEFAVIHPLLYSILSFVGYFFAYPLMTIFVTATECDAIPGRVTFTSYSVIATKNITLLMGMVYMLINSLSIRTPFSLILLSALCGYNIFVRSCHIKWVNNLRSAFFISALWSAIVVAWITPRTQFMFQIGTGVYGIFVAGWVAIGAVMITCNYLFKK